VSTISLTPMPDFSAAVGAPRAAAIEFPYGRPFGQPHDAGGQEAVLRATLDAAWAIDQPGGVVHLPFEWPEEPRRVRWHPREITPIVKVLRDHPEHVPAFLRGERPRG
jgi:hypothetical protein